MRDRRDSPDQRAIPALLVQKDLSDRKERLVKSGRSVPKAKLVAWALLARQGPKESRARREEQVPRARLVRLVQQDQRVRRAISDRSGRPGLREKLAQQALRARKVKLEASDPSGRLDLPVQRAMLVKLGRPAPPQASGL